MSALKSNRRPTPKSTTLIRYLRRKASRKFHTAKSILPFANRIKQLEEEITLLTSHSTDTIYRLRYDTMRYDYISPSVQKLLGYTPQEIKAMNLRSLISETRTITDSVKPVNSFKALEETRQKGETTKWQADYLMTTKEGNKIWISDVSFPWYDKNGRLIGSTGCLRDVTDRVLAEEKAREEMFHLAHTDGLTGLANRRMFFLQVENELKRIQRSRNCMSILLVDIDHFKKINDTHGHDVGDQILAEIGTIIKSCLRQTDLPARLGGEEFGIFLPDTPDSGAYWVAERICMNIAKHTFFIGGNKQKPLSCTVSIGVASSTPTEKLDATMLYKTADTRLYIAKHTGRNQVSMDEIVHMH